MKKWGGRFVYLLILVIWLLVMSFPIVAAVLASRGQIEFGTEGSTNRVRLFLVQDREQEGVGLEWTRDIGDGSCRQGRILYAMWKGSGDNAQYCTCYDSEGALIENVPGACAPD
jgi:hypothetical protein